VGIFTVLAVLVTVAVAGMTISENRQPPVPLEVVIDMPPPPPESVVDQAIVSAPQPVADVGTSSAPDQKLAESRETEAESMVVGGSSPEAQDRGAQRPANSPGENVQQIDTAAGSESLDDMPSVPYSMPESTDVRTEDSEEVAASVVEAADGATEGPTASNETIGAEAEAADEPPSQVDSDSLAATVVEPSIEERQPSVTSTFDAPASLFDAVVVSRRSNLRSEPGPDSPVLAKLNPGDRVFRLDDKPVEGYYRVSADGIVGWIWWLNVSDGPGGNVEG